MIPHRNAFWFVQLSLLVALMGLASAGSVHSGSLGHIAIEDVENQTPGTYEFQAGFRWESGRTLTNNPKLEYDNLRLFPLGLQYGFSDMIELRGTLGFSSNSGDTVTAPDEGGIESLYLGGKIQWSRRFATSLGIGFGTSDDVLPYGGDGLKVDFNVPAQMALGPGFVIGELGFVFQDGDLGGGGNNEWSTYVRYGLGYKYELNANWGARAEIVGHGSPVDLRGASSKSMMELRLTPVMHVTKNTDLKPNLTIGLSDGSPDFALGVNYHYRFGMSGPVREPLGPSRRDRRTRPRSERRSEPLILPGEMGGAEDPGARRSTDPRRAQRLADEGRAAFQEGNLQEAIRTFEQAVQYDPRNVEILSNLGSLYYRRKNYTKAREYYTRAIDADPRDQFSQLYLGITYYRLGQNDDARRHLRRARDLNPGNEQGTKAQKWLDRLP